jgi:CBS domain-containing protein
MSNFVRSQHPVTLPATASVKAACRKMREEHVGAILVTGRDGHLVGIFTGRDAVCRVAADGMNAERTRLAEVMTKEPACMAPNNTAVDALRLMQDGGYRHVPVIERGKLVGIVSHGDFCGLELDRLDEETGIWERI